MTSVRAPETSGLPNRLWSQDSSAVIADRLKDGRLRQAKRIATGLLLGAALIYAAASALSAHYPWLVYVSAASEAAIVGALADWFAVVALFRRPFNIALPHTAIIPRNKARIAQGLGEFIQEQFLSAPVLASKIKESDPAARLARWLAQGENSAALAAYATRSLSFVLDALDERRVLNALRRAIAARVHVLDVASLVGRLLDVLTENQRHQAILDQALAGMRRFLSRAETRNYVAGEISGQWPLARWVAESLHLDEMAARSVLKFIIAKLADIGSDPDHPMRTQFDLVMRRYIERLKSDPALRAKVEQLRDSALENPVLDAYISGLWNEFKDWLGCDLKLEASSIRFELAHLIRNLGIRLNAEPQMRDWINEQILRTVPALVAEHRAGIGRFIERQVNTWQDEKLVHELERHIGVDLQHIRINGTLVGGAAGLLIFSATRLLGHG